MQRNSDGSLHWLTFDLLAECPTLVHAVFLREGGVSSGDFSSLNFGLVQGDHADNVIENRKRALKALNVEHCCDLWQHHGKRVVQAKASCQERGDGMTTQVSNLALMILHADCQAAIFYDPVNHALALAHCGWRGSVQNIYSETIASMQSNYFSKPENILVAISPSLSPLASEFINYQTELPEVFYPFQIKPTYFDFWSISKWQLMQCGILEHHIEISDLCTYSNPAEFFSYRRIKQSGRHATIAYLT